jgi:hypothetical protein
MENIRHQFVELYKYDAALRVAQGLVAKGAAFNDDAVYGYALARASVYSFSRRRTSKRAAIPEGMSLTERLTLERQKPKDQQGAETAGRDTRTLLETLGFLGRKDVTPMGRRLLRLKPRGKAYFELWRLAVLQFSYKSRENGRNVHPAQIVLRMIDANSALNRTALALALDARSDSAEDLSRLLRLLPRSARDLDRLRKSYGKHSFNNASKIIPAWCERVGFIQRPKRTMPYTLTDTGRLALRSLGRHHFRSQSSTEQPPGIASLVAYDPRRARAFEEDIGLRIRTPDEQRETARISRERTVRHEQARELFGSFLQRKGYQLVDSSTSFDLLALRNRGPLLLIEVKSLEHDALERTRSAIGQLHYYRFFKVGPLLGSKLKLVAVFDRELPRYFATFLNWLNIGAFIANRRVLPLNPLAKRLMRLM